MKRHPFNLIELMLALGVIVVGLVSVMALFPVGASANRDAMAENYSAQAAEQMLNTIAFFMRSSGANWDGATDGTAAIPEQPGTASATQTMIEDQVEPHFEGTACDFLGSDANPIYWRTANDYSKGFRIQNTGGGTASGLVDFEAMVALWHEPIVLGGNPRPKISTTLHIEISWPAGIAYERRRKAKYSLQVFNPNQ
ncbi:MAG: type II secretion system protein [Victivallales bacterium]|nr:type II secretion system protein [Victivallales bacterium]